MQHTQRARELRKDQTDAERLLRKQLRNQQLNGFKFRRQVPIGSYIVDFLCMPLKLIVEADGSQHMSNLQYDNSRTPYLESQGFHVARYWNNEVLSQTDSVLETLTLTLSQREREQS